MSTLKFSRKDYDAIRTHGEETYPHECCGVLLGRFENDGSKVVTSTARCGNTRTDSAHNRYNIDPGELVRIGLRHWRDFHRSAAQRQCLRTIHLRQRILRKPAPGTGSGES